MNVNGRASLPQFSGLGVDAGLSPPLEFAFPLLRIPQFWRSAAFRIRYSCPTGEHSLRYVTPPTTSWTCRRRHSTYRSWQLAMEALALVSGSEQPPRRREWFFPQAVCSKRSLGSTARDRNSTGFERNAACSDVGLLHFSFCRTVLSRRWKTRYRSACVRNVLNFWRFCVSGVYD
jgi:hypothetical protein